MAALSFIAFLSSLTELSSDFVSELNHQLRQETYRHHQVFHSAGQVENRLWYLEEGLVRAYYFDRSGREHTLQFFSAGEIIFSWQGLYSESTDYYLEALESSDLQSLGYDMLNKFMGRFQEVKIIAQNISRRRLHIDIYYSRMLTLSAEERYRQFRKVHPGIFGKVSVRIIATYLNMTRENLSKLMTNDLR